MTITNTSTFVRAAGNGVTTVVNFPFKIFSSTDLVVRDILDSTGTPTTLTLNTHYTVTISTTDEGGSVTFLSALTSGHTYDIRSLLPLTQGEDIRNQGRFLPEIHEGVFDKLERQIQDTRRLVGEAITVTDYEPTVSLVLPNAIQRASQFLAFDASGNAVVASGTGADAALRADLANATTAGKGNDLVSYRRNNTEIAQTITPAFYIYAPSPRIDIRRYLTAWDDGSVQTTGLQTAINYAYARKGRLILPDGLNVLSGALSLTMSGNRSTQGLAIEGPGWNGAKITQTGSPTALLTIVGATPTTNPSEAPLVLEGFSLQGVGKTAHGITLDGVAYWRISGVQVRACNAGFNLFSALIGSIDQNCMSNENSYGVLATRHGAGSPCNAVKIRDSDFNLNTTWGLDIESGCNWLFDGIDVEANGTSLNVNTGGMRITAGVVDLLGFAILKLKSSWFESNLGTNFLVDAASGTYISLDDVLMLTAEAHREILISGATEVSIKNCLAPGGAGDIWDISCSELLLENVQATTLTTTGVITPTFINVRTAAGLQASGREEPNTLTLTGCTTSPTGSVNCIQQGDDITLKIPAISGTSNAITATITGLPARYRPAATVFLQAPVTDNGVTDIQLIDISSGGTITLYKAGLSNGLTAAGTKGIAATVLKYKKS